MDVGDEFVMADLQREGRRGNRSIFKANAKAAMERVTRRDGVIFGPIEYTIETDDRGTLWVATAKVAKVKLSHG